MKSSTETWTADGVFCFARAVRSWWVTTSPKVSVRFEIAWLPTLTSPKPACCTFLRSTEAPIAEDPMPASQAKAMLVIGVRPPGRADQRRGHAGLLALQRLHLRGRGGQVGILVDGRSVLSSSDATTKDTAAAPSTDSVTPRKLPLAVWA